MEQHHLIIEPDTESLSVPLDRLFRMPEEVYRQMVAHGFFRAEEVALVDGLLVKDDHFYRMTLDQYDRAVDGSILGPDDPVVLLDGLLVSKMGRNPPHVVVVQLTSRALERLIPNGWNVRSEAPLVLPSGPTGRDSEPEPDLAVVRGDIRDYAARHPRPADMALVVEVAESSLREDRAKLARYAWAGIPTAWIVNLNDRTFEVYANPTGPVARGIIKR